MAFNLSRNDSLSVARIGNTYYLLLFYSNVKYKHQHVFSGLPEAVEFLHKVEQRRQINLEYWDSLDDEVNIHNEYLIRNATKKQKAHLWTGKDTFCKMWSTGGLSLNHDPKAYSLFDSCLGREICSMCINNQQK